MLSLRCLLDRNVFRTFPATLIDALRICFTSGPGNMLSGKQTSIPHGDSVWIVAHDAVLFSHAGAKVKISSAESFLCSAVLTQSTSPGSGDDVRWMGYSSPKTV
jgi:hypothetical protein